jgi:hypothetical protein
MISRHAALTSLFCAVLLPAFCRTIWASPVTGGSNALANPGFETGVLTPWVQGRVETNHGTDWAVTTDQARSGSYSAWVNDNKELRQDFSPIPGSSIREISFWGKHTAAGATEVYVDLRFSDRTTSNKNQVLHTINGVWS